MKIFHFSLVKLLELTMQAPSLTRAAQASSFQPKRGARETMMDMSQTQEINIQIELELRVWM